MSDQESSKGREMNNTRTRALLVLSAIAALCVSAGITQPAGAADNTASSSSSASFSEAEPGVAPAEAEGTSVYLDMAGNVLPVDSLGNPIDQPAGDPAATSSESQAQTAAIGPCTPYSGRDNPHRSSTGSAVSGHGWWDKGDCSNNRANVYNCLYEWYTDNTWRQKDCSSTQELRPGGGSGNRTTARRTCANWLRTSWRNHVDVDVIGEWDSAEKPMRQADVDCRVY